jgi:hypothetical protein
VANYRNAMAFVRSRDVDDLITPRAYSRLLELENWLPEALPSYYLECRLAPESDQVDLMGCVHAWDGGRAELQSRLAHNERLKSHPIWRSIWKLCRKWSSSGSSLHQMIPHLWLSFDIDERSFTDPAPCLLLCLDQSRFVGSNAHGSSMLSAQKLGLLNDDIFELVLGRRPTGIEKGSLESCRDALLSGEQLAHMSMMLTRRPIARKIDISMQASGVLPYLARIDWPGSILGLEKLMSHYCPEFEKVGFQLVVGDSPAATIELELHFDYSSQSQSRYKRLVEKMSYSGICTKEKKTALLRWPGQFSVRLPGEQWHTRWRTWTDVKITLTRGGDFSAKAYLGLSPSASIF